MADGDWRALTAQFLAEAAFSLQSGNVHAAGAAFSTAMGYLHSAARAGDPRAIELLSTLRQALDTTEITQVLEFEPDA